MINQRFIDSVNKWQNAIDEMPKFRESMSLYFETELNWTCGFCEEFHLKESPYSCIACPLFKDGICNTYTDRTFLFWRIADACHLGEYENVIEMCKEMLAEIKKHEKAFGEDLTRRTE